MGEYLVHIQQCLWEKKLSFTLQSDLKAKRKLQEKRTTETGETALKKAIPALFMMQPEALTNQNESTNNKT